MSLTTPLLHTVHEGLVHLAFICPLLGLVDLRDIGLSFGQELRMVCPSHGQSASPVPH